MYSMRRLLQFTRRKPSSWTRRIFLEADVPANAQDTYSQSYEGRYVRNGNLGVWTTVYLGFFRGYDLVAGALLHIRQFYVC